MKNKQYSIASDHPLRKSSWIWPETSMYLHNHYADFRYDFEMKEVPKKAPFYVTADKSYRLYINGKYVCRGPARGYQSHWPFDEVDLKKFLQKGHNWISIEAYSMGEGDFQYIFQNRAAMICAADWGDVKINSAEFGNNAWKMRRSPAHNPNTARCSMQTDYQEDFDASKDDFSWIYSPDYNGVWDKKDCIGKAGNSTPFGQPPYDDVEKRMIPMLCEDISIPDRITFAGKGKCSGDYKNCQNISWYFIENELVSLLETSKDSIAFSRNEKTFDFEMPASGDESYNFVNISMDKISVGTLNIEVEGAEGGEIIDIFYHQCLRDGKPVFLKPGAACSAAFANRIRCTGKTFRRELYHIIGAKDFSIIVRNSKKTLKIKLNHRKSLYPFTLRGFFKSSDKELNSIYEACKYTQQICSLDAYVDTPWREQAQWWGDARVQAKNTFFIDGDARLLARGIRSIAGQRTATGLTYGHAPTISGGCVLPDFALTWILTVFDYYWQTGKDDVFKEQQPRIKEVLAYFASPDVRMPNGLLKYDSRYWLFEDWCDIRKEPVPCFLNMWYLYTLQQYVLFLERTGRKTGLEKLKSEIKSRKELIEKVFFDEEKGLFIQRVGFDLKALPKADGTHLIPSIHDQILAVMTGLKPEYHKAMIEKLILPFIRTAKYDGPFPSSFWVTYAFDVLKEAGYGKDVVGFIRKKWSPMLTSFSAWEGYEWNEKAGGSCSHAWTAHPSSHFVNILAGIVQTAPAWSKIKIEPAFIDGLESAEALVPSPKGDIKSSWRRDAGKIYINVEIPSGVEAEIKLPGYQETLKKSGRYEFTV